MKFCLSIITPVTLAGDNTSPSPWPANTRYREYTMVVHQPLKTALMCSLTKGGVDQYKQSHGFYFIQVDMTSFYFERKDLKRFPYHASYRISLCIALGLVHKLLFLQGGTNLEQVEFRISSG